MRLFIEEKKLLRYVEEGYSLRWIAAAEEVSRSTVRRWMSLHHIKDREVPRPSNKKDYEYLREELGTYLAEGYSTRRIGMILGISQGQISKICRRLQLKSTSPSGPPPSTDTTIYPFCVWCGSTEKKTGKQPFCSMRCSGEAYSYDIIFCKETTDGPTLKRFLLKTRGSMCDVCGRSEWNGLPIPLDLDHVDGHHSNRKPSNLRLICPNCHAQTSTYKGKNKGNGRDQRMKRYRTGKTF